MDSKKTHIFKVLGLPTASIDWVNLAQFTIERHKFITTIVLETERYPANFLVIINIYIKSSVCSKSLTFLHSHPLLPTADCSPWAPIDNKRVSLGCVSVVG